MSFEKLEIISLNSEIKNLKEKIRVLIQEETKTIDNIYVSVVYYEVNTYKKPLKKKKNKK